MVNDRHHVSVVITTVGRDSLGLCRAALERQTRPADETIVIHDHDRRGAAWGRNEGIRRSHGDLIAMVDDDAIPPADWLERLVSAIDTHGADVAGGTYQETDPLLDAIRRRRPSPDDETIDPGGLVGNTGNIVYRRACLLRLLQQDGYYFNEAFRPSGEDWELILRLRKQGVTMVFVPNPVVHLRRTTAWGHLRHAFERGVGIAMLHRAVRTSSDPIVLQDSLLWGRNGQRTSPRWIAAIWEKLIGPFDRHRFQQARHFWLFWLGEKFQSAGFLWEMIQLPKPARPSPAVSTTREAPPDSLRPAA